MILEDFMGTSQKESDLDNVVKSRGITLPTKACKSKLWFSSSHVRIWELNHKEGWMPKNWSFSTVVLEKILESPLDWKIKLVSPKGNQPWIFIGWTDAEAEASVLWPPPDVKGLLSRKDLDAGKDWGWEEKGTTEDELIGWHHQLNGHEFEQTLGDSEGERSLACYASWGCKESDVTELLNNDNNTERVALAQVQLDSEASVCLFFGGALGNPAGF